MTPQEIKSGRETLDLTQTQMAKMLGYGAPARISEIETGRRIPSDTTIRLMRAYLDGYRPLDWPK